MQSDGQWSSLSVLLDVGRALSEFEIDSIAGLPLVQLDKEKICNEGNQHY